MTYSNQAFYFLIRARKRALFRLRPKIFLKPKYQLNKIKSHINISLIMKNVYEAIHNNYSLLLKKLIKMINYLIFKNESRIHIFLKRFTNIPLTVHTFINSIILKEDLRLNLWMLIHSSRISLTSRYSQLVFLRGLTHSLSTDQLKLILPQNLCSKLLSNNHIVNSKVAISKIYRYLLFNHKHILYKLVSKFTKPYLLDKLLPLSKTIGNDVKTNSLMALKIDMKLLRSATIKVAMRSSNCLDSNFYAYIHKLISDHAKRFFSFNTSNKVIKIIQRYDLFLLCLQPSLLIQRGSLYQMQNFLSNLINKNKYYCKLGIKFSLDTPAYKLSHSQAVATIYNFIYYIEKHQSDIVCNMFSNKLV